MDAPVGGSDFLVIKLLARKSGFMATFIQERFANSVKINGSTHGLIHKVS